MVFCSLVSLSDFGVRVTLASYSELRSVLSSLNFGRVWDRLQAATQLGSEGWSQSKLKCHKPLYWDFTTCFLNKHSSDFCQLLLVFQSMKILTQIIFPSLFAAVVEGWAFGISRPTTFLYDDNGCSAQAQKFQVVGTWLLYIVRSETQHRNALHHGKCVRYTGASRVQNWIAKVCACQCR